MGRKLTNRYQNHRKVTILKSVELQLHKEQWNACNNGGQQDFPGIGTSETLQDRDFTRLPWYRTLPSGKRSICQCRGHGFDPRSGKMLHATGQLSLCATITEAHASWSPRSTTRKATTTGSLHSTTREIPHTAAKTQCSQN